LLSPDHIHRLGSFDLRQFGKEKDNNPYYPDFQDERGHPSLWDSPIRFGAIYYLTTSLIQSPPSVHLSFFPELFPKLRIIKPYSNHHHTEYKTSTKIHGYSSFPKLILQSGIIHRTSSTMSFFGVQVGLLQIAL
jgi:hypothetical protein